MAKEPPTVSELRKAAADTDQKIDAAVEAVLADLATETYPLAKGWTLNLVETLRTNTRVRGAHQRRGRLGTQHGPDRDPIGAPGEGMSEDEPHSSRMDGRDPGGRNGSRLRGLQARRLGRGGPVRPGVDCPREPAFLVAEPASSQSVKK